MSASAAPGGGAWFWYWNRLRCMSAGEIVYRVAQTLRVQAQQMGWRTAEVVPTANAEVRTRPFLSLHPEVGTGSYLAAAEELLAGRMTIFGKPCRFSFEWNRDPKTGKVAPLVFGKSINYRDASVVGDIKWLWEPNRHLEFVTLAQAYRLTQDDRYLKTIRDGLDSWFDQCPYLMGVNWTSSLELGIRLINWALVWQLVGGLDSPLFKDAKGAAFRDRWLASVYQHQHFIRGHLSRFSSANNHLIGELAGLYIGSLVWPFWRESAKWRRRARRELVREALRQNAPDGVNREQAISYQQFVFDFLLFAALAGRANEDEFPTEYWQRLERMLEFIAAIMDSSGNVPMIGDADDGYVARLEPESAGCPYRSLLAMGAVLFGRGDFKAKARHFGDKGRWLLGGDAAKTFERLAPAGEDGLPRHFPEGGYYILGADFGRVDEVRVVADAGPLGYQRIAAHGHADALAFTLSIGGQEFLIDPGTYAYHTERLWRDYFRGTAAHNTARVDGQDQSVIGGSFLWTEHANAECHAWERGTRRDVWLASHDGYLRLADPIRHERELIYDKIERRLYVSDRFECRGQHRIERFWHFAEDVDVTLASDGSVLARAGDRKLRIVPRGMHGLRTRRLLGATRPLGGWLSRRFDTKQPTTTIVWESDIDGTTRLDAVIECR
jgi:hypothetical protein